MSSRLQTYTNLNWRGGLNDSLDPGMIPDTDLVIADNVVFGTAGSRLKRQGISYWDNIELPASTGVSRTGTTVTITFGSTIYSSGSNEKLVVGEKITVVCADSACNVTDTAITGVTGTTITYETASSGSVTTTLTSLVRSSYIVGAHDFWYFSSADNGKHQLFLVMTSQGLLFKYDSSGNRVLVTLTSYSPSADVGTETLTLSSHGLITGQAIYFSDISTVTNISINTVYYVKYSSANTFQISTTPGGSAINLTGSNGTLTMKSPLLDSVTRAQFLTMNERCIICMDGEDNWPKLFDPLISTTEYTYLKGAPPNFSMMSLHQGRIFTDDKKNPDLLHYSSPVNHEEWLGVGDSGGVYIGLGDGDPTGIRAISPTVKGNIFIGKTNNLFRLVGQYPEEYQIIKLSGGIGIHSQAALASVDMDDLLFVSDRGIHSILTTNEYGDFKGAFISSKIQNAFKNFQKPRIKYTSGHYSPKLSSVLFSVAEENASQQDNIYLFNIESKEWCRWPDIGASVIKSRLESSSEQLIMGDYESRLCKIYDGSYSDYGTSVIPYNIKTGIIYVDNNPKTTKAFKSIGFLFRPRGEFTFTANIKIDNNPIQSVAFSKTASGDLLGSTFTLGVSSLSYAANMQPFTKPIDGYGRGISVEIVNNGADEIVEIYSIMIEWEPVGNVQETLITGTTTE